jgi:hypothetical protein
MKPTAEKFRRGVWEDDDYNRYLSDLFWDDVLDTAPWMREACSLPIMGGRARVS